MGGVLAFVVASTVAAAGAGEDGVRLEIRGEAPEVDANAIAALLGLELDSRITLQPEARDPGARLELIRLTPAGVGSEQRWRVTVVRAIPAEVAREVDLSDVPAEARARALALTIAEIVRSGPGAEEQVLHPFVWRLSADGAVGFRSHPGFGTTLLDVRAGVAVPLFDLRHWRARIDLGAQFGDQEDRLGRVRIVAPSSRVSVLYAAALPSVRLQVGPALEVGHATATGAPNGGASGASARGWIVSAGLAGTARFRVEARTGIDVGVQIGHALRGLQLQAADRTAAGIGGAMIGASLGFSFDLGQRLSQ